MIGIHQALPKNIKLYLYQSKYETSQRPINTKRHRPCKDGDEQVQPKNAVIRYC